MLYEQQLTGSNILWPKGKPNDRPAPPTEPVIVAALSLHKCEIRMGHNCYEIINEKGDALEIGFGCTIPALVAAIAYLGTR